jgi:hypothetical protein
MKINRFKFHDRALEWKLEPVCFEDLTLLIGASGVGKTQILNALMVLKDIGGGASPNGIEWDIEFETIEKLKYRWTGAFENIEDESLFPGASYGKVSILHESVFRNSKQIVKRNAEEIVFNGKKTPKLSQQESIIKLLKEEDCIAPAYNAFKKIILSDYLRFQNKGLLSYAYDIPKMLKKYHSLNLIRASDEKIVLKLLLAYRNAPIVFKKIKERFIDYFPMVEDIKIEPIQFEIESVRLVKKTPFIQLKESGVNKWISQYKISSGMFRTLIHIAEMYLVQDGTLILIDEFENSLGVNCIDELTDELMAAGRNLRFIITSHHPYIINSIGFKHWKLVTRNAGVVKIVEPEKLNLGKSKHDAFIQLINLEQFRNGIGIE